MKKESFKVAVNFLRQVYSENIYDIANIITAEADNNIERICDYLIGVRNFTDKLINDLK